MRSAGAARAQHVHSGRRVGVRWLTALAQAQHVELLCKVEDTCGAGDAFYDALVHKLEASSSQKAACVFACNVGALVASRRAAIPDYSINDIDEIGM